MSTSTITSQRRDTKDAYAHLNRTLRDSGIKPTRSVDDAYRTHHARIAARVVTDAVGTTTPRQRLHRQLLARYTAEIAARGGETGIVEERRVVGLELRARSGGLALLHAEGWRYYSRAFGARRASLAYLCGLDDNGPWAVRVPGAITSVRAALDWVTPAAVARAELAGRTVLRQGDVYAIESRTDRASLDAADLPGAHRWDAETRTLHHNPDDGRRHRPMVVPFRARLYGQRVYEMGRSGRRDAGD